MKRPECNGDRDRLQNIQKRVRGLRGLRDRGLTMRGIDPTLRGFTFFMV